MPVLLLELLFPGPIVLRRDSIPPPEDNARHKVSAARVNYDKDGRGIVEFVVVDLKRRENALA